MFYGTRWLYRVLYFITAMSPAYFIFLLQINHSFKEKLSVEFTLWNIEYNLDIYWWCSILFLGIISLSLFLRFLLIRQFTHASTDHVLSDKITIFMEENIEDMNGNVTSFLLGNIFPAVMIIDTNLHTALFVFGLIQIFIFALINKSTDVFPNVMLILTGVNLCKTSDNSYVFVFRSKSYSEFKVYQLGNPLRSRIFITMYEK